VLIRTSRSSGPGGQHANVTASRVEASVDLAELDLPDAMRARIEAKLGPRVSAVAQDTRSQTRNRELALERLRLRLAGALEVPKARRASRPSRSSVEDRLRSKRVRSQIKRGRRPPPDE
jgi:ribosome-associated protein